MFLIYFQSPEMNKKIIIITILLFVCSYVLVSNLPKGTYKIEENNVQIKMFITENLLAVRDPDFTKKITILDNNKKIEIEYWSEVYETKIFKRKEGNEYFWVIDDYFRGFSRSDEEGFIEFICDDCIGNEKLKGDDVLGYEFRDGKWIRIK